jgi:hypothetical protein
MTYECKTPEGVECGCEELLSIYNNIIMKSHCDMDIKCYDDLHFKTVLSRFDVLRNEYKRLNNFIDNYKLCKDDEESKYVCNIGDLMPTLYEYATKDSEFLDKFSDSNNIEFKELSNQLFRIQMLIGHRLALCTYCDSRIYPGYECNSCKNFMTCCEKINLKKALVEYPKPLKCKKCEKDIYIYEYLKKIMK